MTTTLKQRRAFTSKTLRAVAYAWIFFALDYSLFSIAVLGLNTSGYVKLILSPWYWILSALAAVAGFGLLRLRWYGWYAFLISNFTIAYQTAIAMVYYSVSPHKLPIFVGTLFLQALVVYIVGKEIRVPYFFPRIRWWESDPRFKLSVQTKITREDKTEVEGEIMDLSLGGCFLKIHSHFLPDELVNLSFVLFDKTVHCSGTVVWRTEATVTHPKGVGVKFDPLPKESTVLLKDSVKKLKGLARFYNQKTRERNWEEYLQREKRYQGKK